MTHNDLSTTVRPRTALVPGGLALAFGDPLEAAPISGTGGEADGSDATAPETGAETGASNGILPPSGTATLLFASADFEAIGFDGQIYVRTAHSTLMNFCREILPDGYQAAASAIPAEVRLYGSTPASPVRDAAGGNTPDGNAEDDTVQDAAAQDATAQDAADQDDNLQGDIPTGEDAPETFGAGEDDDADDEDSLCFPVTALGGTPLDILSRASDWCSQTVLTFADWLLGTDIERSRQAAQALAGGHAGFEDLAYVYRLGCAVRHQIDGEPVAGRVVSLKLNQGANTPPWWKIKISVIHAIQGFPREGIIRVTVPYYPGQKPISQISLVPLDEAQRLSLIERGRIFQAYCTGRHYLSYTGQVVREGWWNGYSHRADGRVMIDIAGLKRIESDLYSDIKYRNGIDLHDDDDDDSAPNQAGQGVLAEEDLWRTFPFLHGFSFTAKRWGRLTVSGLQPIQFRKDAFDKLVMDPSRKDAIRSLVEHAEGSFADIIDGKGGGLIFLLHGSPGLGKTLTAEAVAELLERPLYAIGVGELGTDIETLESRLRNILDIASAWNAVVLLDEADIFLEARDLQDIQRNAMVGVFLRLLEYHQGVLFLTTNRVRNFDTAFHSRVSVALRFDAMDDAGREKVWRNLLDAAGISGLDPACVAHHAINNRQIKNTIRIAQTLAKADTAKTGAVVPVGQDHIERALALCSDLGGLDG